MAARLEVGAFEWQRGWRLEALIQTSLLLSCKFNLLALEQLYLQNKSSEVCIKLRSTPASLPFEGQVTEQIIVKCSIVVIG